MRFTDLEGLIDLPVDAVEHRFRNEHVLAVLPIYAGVAGRDVLLVAIPHQLAVVIAVPGRSDYWTTFLTPWEMVRLGAIESDADIHLLPIHVDGLELYALQWGPTGEQVLRDFVSAAVSGQKTIAPTT